jgi:hypothetical protein
MVESLIIVEPQNLPHQWVGVEIERGGQNDNLVSLDRG